MTAQHMMSFVEIRYSLYIGRRGWGRQFYYYQIVSKFICSKFEL